MAKPPAGVNEKRGSGPSHFPASFVGMPPGVSIPCDTEENACPAETVFVIVRAVFRHSPIHRHNPTLHGHCPGGFFLPQGAEAYAHKACRIHSPTGTVTMHSACVLRIIAEMNGISPP